jgi:hypothetical protein
LIRKLAVLSLGVACLLLGRAWYLYIREWLAVAVGSIDLEYVGPSMLIVPPVAVGAIAVMGVLDALDRPATGTAVGVITALVLLLAIVDNVVGALDDGDVSALGWRIGALSGGMAGTVMAATGIVARRAWLHRPRHRSQAGAEQDAIET